MLTAVCITGSLVASPLFASNFLQKLTPHTKTMNRSTQNNLNSQIKDHPSEGFADFSGTWVGKCQDNEETEVMVLKNSNYQLTVDGKNFTIGALETESSSNQDLTSFSHLLFEWNSDHTSLIFNASFAAYIHTAYINEKTFGYGQGSISLNDGQLILKGHSRTSEGNDDGICIFSKQ